MLYVPDTSRSKSPTFDSAAEKIVPSSVRSLIAYYSSLIAYYGSLIAYYSGLIVDSLIAYYSSSIVILCLSSETGLSSDRKSIKRIQ